MSRLTVWKARSSVSCIVRRMLGSATEPVSNRCSVTVYSAGFRSEQKMCMRFVVASTRKHGSLDLGPRVTWTLSSTQFISMYIRKPLHPEILTSASGSISVLALICVGLMPGITSAILLVSVLKGAHFKFFYCCWFIKP